MKKSVKIILAAVAAVIIVLGFAAETAFVIKTNKDSDNKINQLQAENDKLKQLVENVFDVELDKWTGKDTPVLFTEESLVNKITDAIEKYEGIEIDDIKDIEDLVEFFFGGGLYEEEIHDIYDDTAVVEAYKSGNTEGLSDEDKYVLETTSDIIEEIITADMTDYEKELAVYNWQVKYISYDESYFSAIPSEVDVYDYNYYPYGVLKYHSAICVGNATTFKLFMDLLDIDCMIIHSTEQGEHAWNLVKLEDEWYHVDVTFDGGMYEPDYAYFNVTDSVKDNDGYPWDKDEFPAANGTKYNYAMNNAVEAANTEDIAVLIKECIDNGGGSLFIKSGIEMEDIEMVLSAVESRYSDNSVYTWINYSIEVEDYYLYSVAVIIENYDDEGWNYIDDDEYQNLQELLDGVF